MKKFAFLAPVAVLALAACGDSTDASDDAVADTVEIPADEAMADVPDPVAQDTAAEELNETTVPVEDAEEAADAAVDAADDAMAAAEAAQATLDAAE